MPHVTVPATPAVHQYVVGATPQTEFAVTFPFFSLSGLAVYTLDSDGVMAVLQYSAAPTNNSQFSSWGTIVDGGYTGGTITVGGDGVADVTITIRREIPHERVTDLPYPQQFIDIGRVNTELDLLTARINDIDLDLSRTVHVSDAVMISDNDLEVAAPIAGRALVWNDTATGLENSDHDPDDAWNLITLADANIAAAAASAAAAAASAAAAQASANASGGASIDVLETVLIADQQDYLLPKAVTGPKAAIVFIGGAKLIPTDEYTITDTLGLSSTLHLISAVSATPTESEWKAGDTLDATVVAGGLTEAAYTNGSITTPILADGAATQIKINDPTNIKSVPYLGIGDDTYNDTSAALALIAYAASNGGVAYFPKGKWSLAAALTAATSESVVIRGDGAGSSVLTWSNAGGGIDLTYTDGMLPPHVHGLTLHTTQAANGTALSISSPDLLSSTVSGPIIEDIRVSGRDTATQSWLNGVRLFQCWYPRLSNVSVKGIDDETSPFDMAIGIELADCQAACIRDLTAFHMESAVKTSGVNVIVGEGLKVDSFEIVGVRQGIVNERSSGTRGFFVSNGHINAYEACIKATNIRQMQLSDLELFKTQASVSGWQGIDLNDCDRGVIHDITISCPAVSAGSYSIGIGVANASFMKVHHISFQDWYPPDSSGILVAGSASNYNEFDCISYPETETNLVLPISFDASAGKYNRCDRVRPEGFQWFVASDATPSVGNDISGLFQTAGGTEPALTAFDDGYTGQTFTLLVNSSRVIQHNSALLLKGSANTTAPAGGMLRFVRDTLAWREVSRSY